MAATDASGDFREIALLLTTGPQECTEASLSATDGVDAPVSVFLSMLNTGATTLDLDLTNWLLCGTECSLTCSATVPPWRCPGRWWPSTAPRCRPLVPAAAPTSRWAFGDGTFAEGPTATHSYRFAGTYTWTLSALCRWPVLHADGEHLRETPARRFLSPASLGGLVKGVACTKTVVASGGTTTLIRSR